MLLILGVDAEKRVQQAEAARAAEAGTRLVQGISGVRDSGAPQHFGG